MPDTDNQQMTPPDGLLMPMPNGNVCLRITQDTVAIIVLTWVRRRILFWRKHCRPVTLAATTHTHKPGDMICLEQDGPNRYIATINGEPVLQWPPHDPPHLYRGFGLRFPYGIPRQLAPNPGQEEDRD